MNANELMIGDWVTVVADNKLFPENIVGKTILCKVEGFAYDPIVPSYPEKSVGVDFRPQFGLMVRVANNFGYMYFVAERLLPIPLTKEILKNNGFGSLDESGVSYRIDAAKQISLSVLGKDAYIDDMDARYVHQLQHALRLCGFEKEIELLPIK